MTTLATALATLTAREPPTATAAAEFAAALSAALASPTKRNLRRSDRAAAAFDRAKVAEALAKADAVLAA